MGPAVVSACALPEQLEQCFEAWLLELNAVRFGRNGRGPTSRDLLVVTLLEWLLCLRTAQAAQ